MKNIRTIFIAAIYTLISAIASATVLTFDVKSGGSYVGNKQNIPDSYGNKVSTASTATGNYLQGNGWTPKISLTYLPKGNVDGMTGEGSPVYVNGTNVAVTNASFESADLYPASQRVASWTADSDLTAYPIHDSNLSHTGIAALQMWNYVGIRQNTGHTILANQTYRFTIYVRKFANDAAGVNYLQLFAGDPFGGGTQLGTDFYLTNVTASYQAYTFSYTTPASGAVIGQNLWVRMRHEGAGTFVLMDDVQITYYPLPPAGYYQARTFDGPTWSKVAMLSWIDTAHSNFDFVFTPDMDFAVDLNSFVLDSNSSSTETGTWTVYKDAAGGTIIASGSYNLSGGANQTVTVNMAPYIGTIVLRISISSGVSGNIAIDDINFDQAPANCNGVYTGGYDMASDLNSDCKIDFKDMAILVSNWLMNSPAQYKPKKVIYFGNDIPVLSTCAANAGSWQDLPFDGIVLGTGGFFYNPWAAPSAADSANVLSNIALAKNIQWGKFTDNFMYMTVTGDNNTGIPNYYPDWYDDSTIGWDPNGIFMTNVRAVAQIGEAAGCKGILFDPEGPGTNYVWEYDKQPDAGSYSFAAYQQKVHDRGVQFIQAINQAMPGTTFIVCFWGSMLADRSFVTSTDTYGLYNAFMCGVLDGADPYTIIVDGDEHSYYNTNYQQFVNQNTIINVTAKTQLIPSNLQAKYSQQVRAGHPVWELNPNNPELDPRSSHYVPGRYVLTPDAQTMEQHTYWALSAADRYVWLYTEQAPLYTRIPQIGVLADRPPAIIRAERKANEQKQLGF